MSIVGKPAYWASALESQKISTPAFIYSIGEISGQMRSLQAELGTPLVMAVAACSNPDILARIPEDLRFGVRCASRSEMSNVSGWESDHLYVAMPALNMPTARAVLGGKYRLIIDTPAQLELLAQARGNRTIMPVILGLNIGLARQLAGDLGIEPGFHGMDEADLDRALALARTHNIAVGGIHMYGGRNSFDLLAFPIVRTLARLIPPMESKLGYQLKTVNLGGGLAENWASKAHDFAAYRKEFSAFEPHLQLMHEVGRSVLASAGIFATRVLAVKTAFGQRHAVCDGSLVHAFHLTRAGCASESARQPMLDRGQGLVECRPGTSPGEGTIVLGASASAGDVFGHVAESLEVGDLLVYPDAGAYTQSYSPTLYLGLQPAGCYVHP